ncbi:MAG: hypothetical protein GEU80_15725 [Dehalococcoidia bacterium]|nr:hypothetical protein [Dehalococcoidia bacterium]
MLRERVIDAVPTMLTAVVLAVLVGAAVFALQERQLSRANDELSEARAAADELRRTAGVLEGERDQLKAQVTDQEGAIDAVIAELEESTRQVAVLQAQLGQSGDFGERFLELTQQYAELQGEYQELVETGERFASFVPIRTPELPRDALYLDLSVPGVTYTSAVCSGSMEPNISCEDLQVLYPPRVTDLDVGDIIYYRKQQPDCSGPMEGRFVLHRISRVLIGGAGVAFETKGDALSFGDGCIVPAEDVLYKLLTVVHNGRVIEQQTQVDSRG